jgi:hypothetical protein
MKNFFKLFGIIALAAVIGFSMAACKTDDDGGDGGNGGNGGGGGGGGGSNTIANGTYINERHANTKIVIQGNSWTLNLNDKDTNKGTYTLSGNNMKGRSTYRLLYDAWVEDTGNYFEATIMSEGFAVTSTGHYTSVVYSLGYLSSGYYKLQ